MGKMGANTIANIISKLWSTISIYLFVPLYIYYLGETAYGLVSFFATLQAAMNLLGLGLSNTLRREFAVGDREDVQNGTRKYKLLRSIELIYYGIGVIISAICIFGSDFISSKWLDVESLDPNLVSTVIMLMGFSIALQLVANLYLGCLFGMEMQVRGNIYCVIWSALKSVGSLAIIVWIVPDLVMFYSWHIVTDILYLVILRVAILRHLKYDKNEKWHVRDFSNLQTIWKYTLGILVISFVALINKQLDKMIISGYLVLTELGAYNTATTLGGLSTILPAALYTSIFPRFTGKISMKGQEQALAEEFITINKLTNISVSCIGAFIAMFSQQLILIWTHSEVYAELLPVVAPIVVMAITLIEYQEIPYALALAHGNTKTNVIVGSSFIPVTAVSTWLSIKYYGLLGAACVYLVIMLLQTLIYEFLIYKKYITKHPVLLILRDTLLPLAAALAVSFLFRMMVLSLTDSLLMQVILAVGTGGFSLGAFLILFGRKEIFSVIQSIKAKKSISKT